MNILGAHPVAFVGMIFMIAGVLMIWFSPKPYRLGSGSVVIHYIDGPVEPGSVKIEAIGHGGSSVDK